MSDVRSTERTGSRVNSVLNGVLRPGGGHLVPLMLLLAGAAVAGIGLLLIQRASGPCGQFSLSAQFAGLPGAEAKNQLQRCTGISVSSVMWPDLLLIAGYVLAATAMILGGWWRYETPRLMSLASVVPFLPLVVGVVDLIEDAATLALLRCDPFQCAYVGGSLPAGLVTAIASVKWLLAAILLVVVIMSIGVWISQRAHSFSDDPRNHVANSEFENALQQSAVGPGPLFLGCTRQRVEHKYEGEVPLWSDSIDTAGQDGGDDIGGLCASGGGIRSAAFTLGALTHFEKVGITNRIRRITAVSGGAWGATAWVLQRASLPESSSKSAAKLVREHLQASPDTLMPQHGRRDGQYRPWSSRVRFLLNGPGGIFGPLVWTIICLVTPLMLLISITFSIAWVLGWVLQAPFLYPEISAADKIEPNFNNPGMYVAAAGLFVVVCASASKRIAAVWKPGVVIVVSGVVIFAYTGLLPSLLTYIGGPDPISGLARFWKVLVAATGVGAVLAHLWGLFGKRARAAATGAVQRNLTRLLGVGLALLLVVGGLIVAAAAALGDALEVTTADTQDRQLFDSIAGLGDPSAFAVMVGVLIVLYLVAGANSPTLAQLFAKRLMRSFDVTVPHRLTTTTRHARELSGPDVPGTWAWLAARSKATRPKSPVPELILCCAQQRNGLAPGGLPADSLTISPRRITVGNAASNLTDYLHASVNIRRFGILREFPQIEYVASWLPITGAAFSSAMGRKSLGSTNAAMAAFGADLGAWIPNTRRTDTAGTRPRMAYILKEVLGWYSPADRFVFATDGGHWDNLGLVEQFRNGSTRIICLDASGDRPDSFSTLREAISLAGLELDPPLVVKDLDGQLVPIKCSAAERAPAMATRIRFSCGGKVGVMYYAKLQVSESMSHSLRLYSKQDHKFPSYSTINQFMTDIRFEKLLEAGECAARELADLIDQDVPRPLLSRMLSRLTGTPANTSVGTTAR